MKNEFLVLYQISPNSVAVRASGGIIAVGALFNRYEVYSIKHIAQPPILSVGGAISVVIKEIELYGTQIEEISEGLTAKITFRDAVPKVVLLALESRKEFELLTISFTSE